MYSRSLAAAFLAAALLLPVHAAAAGVIGRMPPRSWAAASPAAALLPPVHAPAPADRVRRRVFPSDGPSLVISGGPARVGDRVFFSMPRAPGATPPLHLINLPMA